jgi:Uma2 family endonuclease
MGTSLRSTPRRIDLDDFEEMLLDCPGDEKWELIDGRVVRSVVGARYSHHRIVRNVSYALQRQLDGKPGDCQVFTETFRLAQRFTRLSALPDVMVRCGPMDPDATSLEDPVLLMEVVGPASDLRDKVVKLDQYRRLASLRTYVMIERDEMRVVAHVREGDGWREREALTAPEDMLSFPEIGATLTLAEIYRDLT